MPDCFDQIDNAASSHAQKNETNEYQSLVQCLGYKDQVMALAFLKFVNNMIYKAQEEKKQAKFVAKLDLLGIFDLLRDWNEKGNEDINQ
jgi:hypothetical protein